MLPNSWRCPEPRECWQWDRTRLAQWQVDQFNRQLDVVLPTNVFYQRKLREAGIPLESRIETLDDLSHWPLTRKQELVESAANDASGLSHHHTYRPEDYSRLHRTSGTKGQPLMLLDSSHDWKWWSSTWQHVLEAAGITSRDRVFLAFSFGPFIGFWSAHQACADRGAMVIPAGGLSTIARLEFLRQSAATAVCCTPSYALHIAEVAKTERFPLAELPVRRLIVAGEVGGSLPTVRQTIESAWNARVVDHAGATEIGPWGLGWPDGAGLNVIETSFIAELLPLADRIQPTSLSWESGNVDGERPSPGAGEVTGDIGELVLTSLGRYGAPVLRYRTGDIVRAAPLEHPGNGRCKFLWLPEGIIGRSDDMLTVRGINIFPSSIECIIRSLPSIAEYQVVVRREGALDQLCIRIEASPDSAQQLEKLLTIRLGLRIDVQEVPHGSLPRSEGKSRRWIREQ